MTNQIKAIPEGYHTITPYLIVSDAAKAITFYKKAFNAVEALSPLAGPHGKIGHAELKIGDSRIMLADEFPDMGARGPKTLGGSPINLLIYIEDVDAWVKQAVAAGAKLTRPVEDRFYGDRSGQLEDPFGHVWTLATHIEDISPEEMTRRAAAQFGK